MPRHIRWAATMVGLVFMLAGAQSALRADTKSSVEEIRKELMQLPYYSVFDYLAFSYDKGTVTLAGYAYHVGLKQDAVRAAKRAPGVDQVVAKIEELSVSKFDDDIRWKTTTRSTVIRFSRGTRPEAACCGATDTHSAPDFTAALGAGSPVWSRSAISRFTLS